MRPFVRMLVMFAAVAFLPGCFSVQPAPLPAPEARDDTEIRGVVVGDSIAGHQEVRFDEIYDVDWGQTDLSIQGLLDDGESPRGPVRRSYRYSELSGVLTRQLNVDRTSLLIGGSAIGAILVVVFFFTERTGGAGTVVVPGG